MISAPTVLVTDADRGSALSVIRSLGRKGWSVIAGGHDRGSVGFRSRHASRRLLYPAPAREPTAFVERVLEAASRDRVDLILSRDRRGDPSAPPRAESVPRCVPPGDPRRRGSLRTVLDKDRTVALASSLGVPTPRTVLATTVAEGCQAARCIGWPVVLKPRSSRVLDGAGNIDSFEVSYAASERELRETLRGLEGRCDVLIQEYCRGVGRGVGLLLHEGKPLAAFQHRRIHEVPLTAAPAHVRVGEPLDAELYDHSVRILGALRWTGLAMVEFKVGGGGPKLMEVNGRVWGSLPLAVMSGVDFPSLLARALPDGSAAPGRAAATRISSRAPCPQPRPRRHVESSPRCSLGGIRFSRRHPRGRACAAPSASSTRAAASTCRASRIPSPDSPSSRASSATCAEKPSSSRGERLATRGRAQPPQPHRPSPEHSESGTGAGLAGVTQRFRFRLPSAGDHDGLHETEVPWDPHGSRSGNIMRGYGATVGEASSVPDSRRRARRNREDVPSFASRFCRK
jgi:biotin carboxylase